MNDIEAPFFINDTLDLLDTYLSHTNTNNTESMNPFAKQLTAETYVCSLRGAEKFRLVSPVFKQNMYSGVRQELGPNQSPVDLFHKPFDENVLTFPLLRELQMNEVDLKAGDCLFVPAWWWIQRRTIRGKSYSTE